MSTIILKALTQYHLVDESYFLQQQKTDFNRVKYLITVNPIKKYFTSIIDKISYKIDE